jgi:hypothetical protein
VDGHTTREQHVSPVAATPPPNPTRSCAMSGTSRTLIASSISRVVTHDCRSCGTNTCEMPTHVTTRPPNSHARGREDQQGTPDAQSRAGEHGRAGPEQHPGPFPRRHQDSCADQPTARTGSKSIVPRRAAVEVAGSSGSEETRESPRGWRSKIAHQAHSSPLDRGRR